MYAVNATEPCVYDNNNNAAKNNADLDNLDNNESLNHNGGLNTNGGLNKHLDIGDNLAEEHAKDITSKDHDDAVDFADENKYCLCFRLR
ncbi:hypothetical protein A9G39_06365 [Gilliamella sp. Imp1-6]|nr:hypothetical protein A9G39_06365 [Gilliamella apicola]